MTNYTGQNINRRLIGEIRAMEEPDDLKCLLEELLLLEHTGVLKHEYKEEYKKLIRKVLKNKS